MHGRAPLDRSIVVTARQHHGSLRVCIDCQAVNKLTSSPPSVTCSASVRMEDTNPARAGGSQALEAQPGAQQPTGGHKLCQRVWHSEEAESQVGRGILANRAPQCCQGVWRVDQEALPVLNDEDAHLTPCMCAVPAGTLWSTWDLATTSRNLQTARPRSQPPAAPTSCRNTWSLGRSSPWC